MRVPQLMLAAGVLLGAVSFNALPVPAASPNAASNVKATLEVDEETGVTSLVITGDQKNYSIVVTEVDGTIFVIGQAKTKVNKRKFPATFDAAEVTSIQISMGAGDDTVLDDLDLGADTTLDADGGDGNDSLTVTGTIDAAATVVVEGFETLDPPDLGL